MIIIIIIRMMMMKLDEGTPTCQSGALKIIINKLPC